MLPYQDPKANMWYQVINLPQIKPNYPEASGSSIFAYAIMKGARLGILPASYYEYGKRAFDGICRTCIKEENNTSTADSIKCSLDRKSTRLNSSHVSNSYAVF